MNLEIAKTINVLKKQGVILYPTDTVWGIGCDATNITAVSKIYKIKQREESKSLVVLVSDIKMLKKYITSISLEILKILKEVQKPTTIIYKNPKGLANNVVALNHTIAIRIPKNNFCIQLIKEFGKPIVSTSANISGEPTPTNFSEIKASILHNVDYVVNSQHEKTTKKSSTILKIEDDGQITVIRP